MTVTTVSPKFQVVIPKEVRNQVPIRSGQRVTIMAKGGVIYIVPLALFPHKVLGRKDRI